MTKITNTTANTSTTTNSTIDSLMNSTMNMSQNGPYTTYTMPVYSNGTATGNTWHINTGVLGTTGQYTYTNPGTFESVKVGESGDIKIGNRSLKNFMDSVEKRLCILDNPDPEKLAKFAALKEAYEYYKLMEKLIGE